MDCPSNREADEMAYTTEALCSKACDHAIDVYEVNIESMMAHIYDLYSKLWEGAIEDDAKSVDLP